MDGQHFGRTRRDAPVRQPLRILRLGKRLIHPEPIEPESGNPNEQCTAQSLDTLKRWTSAAPVRTFPSNRIRKEMVRP